MKKTVLTIYKKELKNYFFSPASYVFALLFALISVWLYLQPFFINQQASLGEWFTNLSFLLLFFIPALTMGALAEEKKSGTWEVLLTLPVDEFHVVLAKFLAGMTFVLTVFLTTVSLPITLSFLGQPDWGTIASGYLGAVLLAGGYFSLGLFVSSLTNQQTLGFIAALVALLINDIFSQSFFLLKIPFSLKGIFTYLSLNSHYQNLVKGVISLADGIFFASWIFIFLVLTIASLKSRDY